MLNVSGTVRDTDTVSIKYYALYSTVSFRITLTDLERFSQIFDDMNRRAVSATAELLV